MTGLLAAIMGNFGFGDSTEYQAVFTTASMLEKGDDVRVAGVSVGEVKKVEHYHRNQALVTFRVKSEVPLTTTSRAEIRFLNLVGDRYLALEAGDEDGDAMPDGIDDGIGGTAAPTRPAPAPAGAGATIPVDQTTPALDLTTLFNGFQPLFQALDPKQVNELSMNLVQVLQGEGGTIQELLANTASLTNSLADRDELIGQVVNNLTQTLDTVDQRHQELNTLVVRAAALDGRPGPRPQHHRQLARQHLRPDRRGRRPAPRGPAAREERRRQAASSWPRCSTSPRTSSRSPSSSTGCPSR